MVSGYGAPPRLDPTLDPDDRLLESAPFVLADASLRPTVVPRFGRMGEGADHVLEAALAPPSARNGFTGSITAAVTAIFVLEARPDGGARLGSLVADSRPWVAAQARVALERRGVSPAPGARDGGRREEVASLLASRTASDRCAGFACVLARADLFFLREARAALRDRVPAVREAAIRTCTGLGDSSCFDLLMRRLDARPESLRDALAAWKGLCRLADARFSGAFVRFASDQDTAWLCRDFDGEHEQFARTILGSLPWARGAAAA
jgi:hypothetical protein